MISANGITFRVGKKALFEDVNIQFTEGNCYGLIGANGTGKSTFLKILSGRVSSLLFFVFSPPICRYIINIRGKKNCIPFGICKAKYLFQRHNL